MPHYECIEVKDTGSSVYFWSTDSKILDWVALRTGELVPKREFYKSAGIAKPKFSEPFEAIVRNLDYAEDQVVFQLVRELLKDGWEPVGLDMAHEPRFKLRKKYD